MDMDEEEWMQDFEGMTEEEILAAPLPSRLSDEQCFRFRALQEKAAKAARESAEQAELHRALAEVTATTKLQPQPEAGDANCAPPDAGGRLVLRDPPLPFAIPEGKTDVLLDKQIASCAGIIEHLAHYIARYDSATETCNKFMDRIGSMMRSSAEAAIAVGYLRGMAPEGRRRRW